MSVYLALYFKVNYQEEGSGDNGSTRVRKGSEVSEIYERRRGKTRRKQTRRNLKVHYTNCRSILHKIGILRGLTSMEKCDAIAITETWLDMTRKVFNPEVEI